MVMYHCLESAVYTNKKDGFELRENEVWDKVSSTQLNFNGKPFVKYYMPASIQVDPVHFERVMIL